ncbi:MAG TPA: glycosyltransferase family 2 protein [Candidatus Thermoplasmatota archaeon]|nr:glycosyltransferase family 2 protein [Candidatus Thermoplasmatota archaeon]
MKVLALIPAYNEEGKVGDVVRGVRALGHACLVLDDGSKDRTAEVARAAGAIVVSNRHNMGLGRTIRRAFQEALKTDATIIVQLDADGQHDPAEIPKLLAPIEAAQADMVLGWRETVHYKMPLVKKLGNRAFSAVLRSLTDQDIKDGQTGFRAMHREVLEKCLPINEFSYTQEMIIRAAKEGFVIQSVPIEVHRRYDETNRLFGSSFKFAFRSWWIIIRTWRDYHPFKFFVWPGLVFLLLALVLMGDVAWHLYRTHTIAGVLGTLIGGGVLFLFGVQLVFIGLLADMIRTHTKY